jgi:hypothetical protein
LQNRGARLMVDLGYLIRLNFLFKQSINMCREPGGYEDK